jgi:hypothetical protein
MESKEKSTPEVMHFKASQKLLKPNEKQLSRHESSKINNILSIVNAEFKPHGEPFFNVSDCMAANSVESL